MTWTVTATVPDADPITETGNVSSSDPIVVTKIAVRDFLAAHPLVPGSFTVLTIAVTP